MATKKYKEPIQVFPTGEEELEKHEVFKYNRTQHKFNDIMSSSNDIIYSIKTIIPFKLFPDTLSVDRVQVTVSVGIFLGVRRYHSFLIEQIQNVKVVKGILFSSIAFEFSDQKTASLHVQYLQNMQALKFKSVVDCLLAAQAEELDVDDLSTEQIWQLVDHMRPKKST